MTVWIFENTIGTAKTATVQRYHQYKYNRSHEFVMCRYPRQHQPEKHVNAVLSRLGKPHMDQVTSAYHLQPKWMHIAYDNVAHVKVNVGYEQILFCFCFLVFMKWLRIGITWISQLPVIIATCSNVTTFFDDVNSQSFITRTRLRFTLDKTSVISYRRDRGHILWLLAYR